MVSCWPGRLSRGRTGLCELLTLKPGAKILDVIEKTRGRSQHRILHELLYCETSVPVERLARVLGISRNATYQHVTALERDGLIEKASRTQTKGRPVLTPTPSQATVATAQATSQPRALAEDSMERRRGPLAGTSWLGRGLTIGRRCLHNKAWRSISLSVGAPGLHGAIVRVGDHRAAPGARLAKPCCFCME